MSPLGPSPYESMKTWRVIETGCLDCYFNMAIDEALFESFAPVAGAPVLRIYGWRTPAFSIGYSRNPQDELYLDKCQADNIDFVRRITGGGVIFHNNELTYSIVCSKDDLGVQGFSKEAYKRLCSFILRTYRNLGLDAEYSMRESARRKSGWFCFAERERYDILINKKKIGGNAQRRRREVIFQHGSIPLKSDMPKALKFVKNAKDIRSREITSLTEELGRPAKFEDLSRLLVESFKETFGNKVSKTGLSEKEKELSRFLLNEKYSTKEWNFYRDASRHGNAPGIKTRVA